MTGAPPLLCRWDGEHFTPAGPHWARMADKHFVVGALYPLEAREDRSVASHRHFFAAVNEAWQNLPDDLAARFPSPDHLRKWALIKSGYRDERSIVCASKAEAQRVAAFVKPIDGFAVVIVSAAVVTLYTAKSQSVRAMGKEEFGKSKDAVLDALATLIGTSADELRGAGEAA